MTARETLEAARDWVISISAIERLIDAVNMPFGSRGYPSVALTGMPRGGNDNTSAACSRMDRYENLLKREKWNALTTLDDAETLIDKLQDSNGRKIMRAYYLKARVDASIAIDLGMTTRRVCEARAKAMQVLEEMGKTLDAPSIV